MAMGPDVVAGVVADSGQGRLTKFWALALLSLPIVALLELLDDISSYLGVVLRVVRSLYRRLRFRSSKFDPSTLGTGA